MAMKSLYCANEKGKFWQVHDLLMSQAGYEIMNGYDATQQPTKGPVVKNDKAQSGALSDFLKNAVDPSFLKSCLDSGKYDAQLTSDQALATSIGIQGTPGFYVNATSFAGAYSWTDMKSAVDAALK
jgi:protein-disulfide isomerase